MALTLRPERPEDLAAARRVHERAFSTQAEADLVDALRAEGAHVPEICLVALRDEQVVGHIVFSRARLVSEDGVSTPLLVLAPLAVDPDLQRGGIGAALLREALRRAPAA
ncbi:MAG TPA: N-acetyltransferase, partial [Conexibacter sp.]|nr:N-acetyltransferase [Conexibacter sp.]